jgi:hypothetical protein
VVGCPATPGQGVALPADRDVATLQGGGGDVGAWQGQQPGRHAAPRAELLLQAFTEALETLGSLAPQLNASQLLTNRELVTALLSFHVVNASLNSTAVANLAMAAVSLQDQQCSSTPAQAWQGVCSTCS